MSEKKAGRTGWLMSILIVTLLCFIAVMGAIRLSPEKTRSLSDLVNLPVYSTQNCSPMGTGVIYYDGSMLYALDGKGARKWNYYAGANAGFDVSSSGICTWTGSLVSYLNYDTGTQMFSVTMPGTVMSAKAGSTYIAVCTGEEDSAIMKVLDKKGVQVDSIDSKDVTVLDYGFFSDGNLLWIMTLDTDGTVPLNCLKTYKPGRSQTGSITDDDEIVYKTMFYSSYLRTVGTQYIRTYDYKGIEDTAARTLLYGWYMQDVYTSGDNDTEPLMVFISKDQAGTTGSFQDLRIIKGNTERFIRMPYRCSEIYAGKNVVYGFTGQYLIVYYLSNGEHVIYQMPVYADDVIGMTDDFKAIVSSEGSMYLVQLPS